MADSLQVHGITRRTVLTAGMMLGATAAGSSLNAVPTSYKIYDFLDKNLAASALAQSLEGTQVLVTGYMAPPPQDGGSFFVLVRLPLSACPFCDPELDWPDHVLAVYTKRPVRPKPFNVLLSVRGTLKLGQYEDPDTGFVSRIRLLNASYVRTRT